MKCYFFSMTELLAISILKPVFNRNWLKVGHLFIDKMLAQGLVDYSLVVERLIISSRI